MRRGSIVILISNGRWPQQRDQRSASGSGQSKWRIFHRKSENLKQGRDNAGFKYRSADQGVGRVIPLLHRSRYQGYLPGHTPVGRGVKWSQQK